MIMTAPSPSTPTPPNTAFLRDPDSTGWWRFAEPHSICVAFDLPSIPILLDQIREHTSQGRWAAGFLSYEAAPAFDPAFTVHAPLPGLPLAWFGVYDRPQPLPSLPSLHHFGTPAMPTAVANPAAPELEITHHLDHAGFTARVEAIRQAAARGATYQANFTSMLQGRLPGDPLDLFAAMYAAQPSPHAAAFFLDDWAVCCASPELFFEQREDRIHTRPMKGTRHRGRWTAEDQAMGRELLASAKDRAENVMIVDLLRNDLGRIARPGSVHVDSLFDLERYPTIWQMTSTISARSAAHPVETLSTLFPCGSITGAPKIETMRILRELETAPRGVYTGAIGWFGPERTARFSVAIRTALVRRADRTLYYGVGGGITWASDPQAEFHEAQLKSNVLRPAPQFQLLEALLHEPGHGWFLLDAHLARLRDSAGFFDFTFEETRLREQLSACAAALPAEPVKVRIVLHKCGRAELSHVPLGLPSVRPDRQAATADKPLLLALADTPVSSGDTFLFHKTSHRSVYDRARAGRPHADDVLLWNENEELTESCRANLVVETAGGRLLTPHRACGLLAGVFRDHLLKREEISEATIRKPDLAEARRLWLINSVRLWMPAALSSGACRMDGKQAAAALDIPALRENA